MSGAQGRLDAIRDAGDRAIGIARDLVTHGDRRLTRREITWLRERLRRSDPMIPFLQPPEYDALIRALLREVRFDDQPEEIET